MIELYPHYWIYYDMADEEGGGGSEDDGESEDIEYGEDDTSGADVEYGDDDISTDIEAPVMTAPVEQVVVDVSTILGNKYLQSLVLSSDPNNPLIDGVKEGNIPSEGLSVLTYVIGNPGARFYLDIVDIDDDPIFSLSNVQIQASGRYTFNIPFPRSSITNKYKINLRPGDGTRINTSLPTTDPMYTIHQLTNPTLTFTKATGTGTGVTYSGDNVTLTANPYTPMGTPKGTRLINSTNKFGVPIHASKKVFGELTYAVTAAKSGAKVYVKNTAFAFTNSTTVNKLVELDVVDNNIIQLADVSNLEIAMQCELDSHVKTKISNIGSTKIKLSNTNNLVEGMLLQGAGTAGAYIVLVDNSSEITVSDYVSTANRDQITFSRTDDVITIKSVDTNLNQVVTESPITLKKGTILAFKNNEMDFTNKVTISGSGSASTTLTNTIKTTSFGSKDVTFTLPTDDIFTLTPNAYNQKVEIVKETATDINVLLLDNDDNSGSKTPSTVREPAHGKITGSYGSGDGTITYTPNVGFIGQDSFDFKVSDGTTNSNVKTIFITVHK